MWKSLIKLKRVSSRDFVLRVLNGLGLSIAIESWTHSYFLKKGSILIHKIIDWYWFSRMWINYTYPCLNAHKVVYIFKRWKKIFFLLQKVNLKVFWSFVIALWIVHIWVVAKFGLIFPFLIKYIYIFVKKKMHINIFIKLNSLIKLHIAYQQFPRSCIIL